jgi:predicted DNA-binding protein
MEENEKKVFLGINLSKEVKDKLISLSKEKRRSVSAQASLIIEQALEEKLLEEKEHG